MGFSNNFYKINTLMSPFSKFYFFVYKLGYLLEILQDLNVTVLLKTRNGFDNKKI